MMAKEKTDNAAQEIAEFRRELKEVKSLLTMLLVTGVHSERAKLLGEITELLKDVPDGRLQSALDYITYLASGPGGDEDGLVGQEG